MMKPISTVILLIVFALSSPSTRRIHQPAPSQEKRPPDATKIASPYLFVWTADADERDSDFLAVIDAQPSSSTYGEVIATLPVGVRGTSPHHTEYEFPAVWPKPGWQWAKPVGREEVG